MRAFSAGDIDLIVATTVIEVGVDVPNASTMVVLDADRFGVSQLHQLRGRVGRGGVPGLCLMVTHAEPETVARERVDAVAATLDGFELARVDLEPPPRGQRARHEPVGRPVVAPAAPGRAGRRPHRVRARARPRRAGGVARARGPPALARALARRLDDEERAFLDKN
ncbi:helicase-related protein [Clavibacter tessellarius]